ncbi:uncharacterized protein LOC110856312 isoform X2 [Folsomia candida]|uniref:Uncharacterized protein n=1 Tax=Folsomia candida TaxID=158441 RepID=A0A226DQV8_FOLCA|nr:uncharacterized protein LOC110856312 isoform X2 [Folsomia candida]OXA46586.1 hypothetical protein Fcan01_18740 [Folsomia candida]
MTFNKHLICWLAILTFSVGRSSAGTLVKQNGTDFFSSRAINSRPFVGNPPGQDGNFDSSPFVQSKWTIWDKPQDQLAVEGGQNVRGTLRESKNYYGTRPIMGSSLNKEIPAMSYSFPNGNTGSSPTQRQDCNSNTQVTVFPIIMVLIAAIAGLITVAIVWLIARKWTDYGSTSSTGHQYSGYNNGYNNGRGISQNLPAILKNFDFDQLTNLVIKGIETYRSSIEKKSA